jgi:hypothetical protein
VGQENDKAAIDEPKMDKSHPGIRLTFLIRPSGLNLYVLVRLPTSSLSLSCSDAPSTGPVHPPPLTLLRGAAATTELGEGDFLLSLFEATSSSADSIDGERAEGEVLVLETMLGWWRSVRAEVSR